jgi:hypothetical protein
MAGNLSCNTDFLIVNNSVRVELILSIKNLPNNNKLLSGLTLHKKNKQHIRYAISIRISKQLLNLLNRKNEIILPYVKICNRNKSLQIKFNYTYKRNQLVKQRDNFLFIYKVEDSDFNFKFIGELYPTLFKDQNPLNTLRKEERHINEVETVSSVDKEQKKNPYKSSKVKTYYDPSVIQRKTIEPDAKKSGSTSQKKMKNQTNMELSNQISQREILEQKNKTKNGIYLSKSNWKLCENCMNLQKHNICSVFKIEVEDNNCCKRFYPITVILGGAFSPR